MNFRGVIMVKAIIREMKSNDIEGKAYVHYKSWHETYTGIIPDKYMEKVTPQKCLDIANKYPKNTIVAIVDDKVIGFACYGQSKDEDLVNAGELIAIYILKEYQGRGIGRLMADVCFKKMSDFDYVSVWVLSKNYNAISFYRRYGFEEDGVKKIIRLGEPIEEMRMIKHQ